MSKPPDALNSRAHDMPWPFGPTDLNLFWSTLASRRRPLCAWTLQRLIKYGLSIFANSSLPNVGVKLHPPLRRTLPPINSFSHGFEPITPYLGMQHKETCIVARPSDQQRTALPTLAHRAAIPYDHADRQKIERMSAQRVLKSHQMPNHTKSKIRPFSPRSRRFVCEAYRFR